MIWYHPKYYKEMRAERRKLQARVIQFQDQGARVQAKVPKLQGTSTKDKGIFWMSNMKRNLVRRKPHRVNFSEL